MYVKSENDKVYIFVENFTHNYCLHLQVLCLDVVTPSYLPAAVMAQPSALLCWEGDVICIALYLYLEKN